MKKNKKPKTAVAKTDAALIGNAVPPVFTGSLIEHMGKRAADGAIQAPDVSKINLAAIDAPHIIKATAVETSNEVVYLYTSRHDADGDAGFKKVPVEEWLAWREQWHLTIKFAKKFWAERKAADGLGMERLNYLVHFLFERGWSKWSIRTGSWRKITKSQYCRKWHRWLQYSRKKIAA